MDAICLLFMLMRIDATARIIRITNPPRGCSSDFILLSKDLKQSIDMLENFMGTWAIVMYALGTAGTVYVLALFVIELLIKFGILDPED